LNEEEEEGNNVAKSVIAAFVFAPHSLSICVSKTYT
jgi:hypothetical protein